MATPSLYQIREEHWQLIAQIEEQDGEIYDDQMAQLGFTEEAFQAKALSCGYVYRKFEDDAMLIKAERDRLDALLKRAEKRAEKFKEFLADAMKQFKCEKITSPTMTISFRKSKSVEITCEEDLPDEAMDEVPASWKPNKTKIKALIENGVEVAGACIKEKQNLQIK